MSFRGPCPHTDPMAYYGIPSAGKAVTASTGNDTVALANLGSTVITAASVYGEVGNDVISLGAVGRTAVATASISAANKLSGRGANTGAAITLSGHLVGSSTYTTSTTFATGIDSGSVAVTGVLTSQQAARTINGALFQANAGNDSIALGDELNRVSATTFAGGAGNDIIGGYTFVNNQWAAVTVSGGIFVGSEFQGSDESLYQTQRFCSYSRSLSTTDCWPVDFQSAVVTRAPSVLVPVTTPLLAVQYSHHLLWW